MKINNHRMLLVAALATLVGSANLKADWLEDLETGVDVFATKTDAIGNEIARLAEILPSAIQIVQNYASTVDRYVQCLESPETKISQKIVCGRQLIEIAFQLNPTIGELMDMIQNIAAQFNAQDAAKIGEVKEGIKKISGATQKISDLLTKVGAKLATSVGA